MKKKSTAEYAEIAELILGKDKKYKPFYGSGLLLAFRSSGDRDKRMNKEEAENAEIVAGKVLSRFDLLRRVRKNAVFPLHSGAELLALFTSARSATSAVKFFIERKVFLGYIRADWHQGRTHLGWR